MPKVVLSGYIVVPDHALIAVQQELPTHIALTLREAGCTGFSVIQDANNPNRFEVNESFVDEAAFEQHQQRVKGSVWGQVSGDAERHYQIERT